VPKTFNKAKRMLENFVYPRLGDVPVTKITAPELPSALRRIEVRGTMKRRTAPSNAAAGYCDMQLPPVGRSRTSPRIFAARWRR
jgi:hypothetical protein